MIRLRKRLIFVGSPWVTQISAFASLGLTLTDFAASDPPSTTC